MSSHGASPSALCDGAAGSCGNRTRPAAANETASRRVNGEGERLTGGLKPAPPLRREPPRDLKQRGEPRVSARRRQRGAAGRREPNRTSPTSAAPAAPRAPRGNSAAPPGPPRPARTAGTARGTPGTGCRHRGARWEL